MAAVGSVLDIHVSTVLSGLTIICQFKKEFGNESCGRVCWASVNRIKVCIVYIARMFSPIFMGVCVGICNIPSKYVSE